MLAHTQRRAALPMAAAAATNAAAEHSNPPEPSRARRTVADLPRGAAPVHPVQSRWRQLAAARRMPAKPTLVDFFALRFDRTRNHCFQAATLAMKHGADEPTILAALLHDTVQELMRSDHGYWGAQLYEHYVPERTAFAVKYHQALRFYPDEKAGYEYPDFYRRIFGVDYVPAPHVQADYQVARKHRWYDAAREVTVCDLYAFDENAKVSIDPFVELIGRHFKQPKEGLGNDHSPVAHMWRTLANPDAPL